MYDKIIHDKRNIKICSFTLYVNHIGLIDLRNREYIKYLLNMTPIENGQHVVLQEKAC